MRAVHIDWAEDYKPGDQRPTGIMNLWDWADVQLAAGLKQRQCWKCGLWRFPQETCCGPELPVSDRMDGNEP